MTYTDRYRMVSDQAHIERVFKPEHKAAVSLQGEIHKVTVFNVGDGWGFGECYISDKRLLISFTGIVDSLYPDARVKLSGRWDRHKKYGWQIKMEICEVLEPTTQDGVYAWLIHRMPEVGPMRAREIIRLFPPPKIWDVLADDPAQLAEVQGLSVERAAEIGRAYEHWRFEREQFAELAELGLKPLQIKDAVKRWRGEAADKVREDPYCLRLLPAFGWKATDAIARKMGVKRADPRRVRAGLGYATERRERDGHCASSDKKLMSVAGSADILGLSPRHVVPHLDGALEAGDIVRFSAGLYRPETFKAEQTVAEDVARLVTRAKDGHGE